MEQGESLPGYEPMLSAYHRAFAAELRGVVDSLPIAEGSTVLDMACGDGAYTPWLARRAGPAGRVVAVDAAPAYLEVARRHSEGLARNVDFLRAPIDALPFRKGAFDFCWCAQSLYSLPDPVDALRCMSRVTRSGGVVAVLESDTLHHVILPWPVDVELSVRAAEFRVLAGQFGDPRKFYVGRNLRSVFRKAGLEDVVVRTIACDRASPLGPREREFLAEHLKELSDRVAQVLDDETRRRFGTLTDPESSEFLLDDPDLTSTCIDQVAWGRRP
jgi:ubiquinone/menaquinone biosynthesis C-methylase UbiE